MSLELQHQLEELLRRMPAPQKKRLDKVSVHHPGSGDYLLEHLFRQQREFVISVARQKAALCTRRAGKSEAVAAVLHKTAVENTNSISLYYAPTKRQAKKIIWPKLKRLATHYGIQVEFKETESALHYENGSVVYVYGADKISDIDAALGLACHLIVLDEAGSFGPHLELLVTEVLGPTLFDYQGTMIMTGTPTRNHSGFYYDVTTEKRGGWELHKWSVFDNSEMPRWAGKPNWQEIVQQELEEELEQNGLKLEDPVVQRQWFGRWVKEENSILYNYTEKNIVDHLPHNQNWRGVLGIDIGKNLGYQVAIYSTELNTCYLVHGLKLQNQLSDDIAETTVELKGAHGCIYKFVMDTGGLGDMIAEEIRRRHGLPIIPAKKSGKLAFINVVNSMLRRGTLKVLRGNPVLDEWDVLQKDENGEEIPGSDNHCSDATLYAVRECTQYLSIEKGPEDRTKEEIAFDEWEQSMLAEPEPTDSIEELEDVWTSYN